MAAKKTDFTVKNGISFLVKISRVFKNEGLEGVNRSFVNKGFITNPR